MRNFLGALAIFTFLVLAHVAAEAVALLPAMFGG